MEIITSPHNPRLKWAATLRDARHRKREHRLLIDGWEMIQRALDAGIQCIELFLNSDSLTPEIQSQLATLTQRCPELHPIGVAPTALRKLQYGEREETAIAVAIPPDSSLDGLARRIPSPPPDHSPTRPTPPPRELFLVLDRMEKPGNLGAILRSADAAGATAVLLSDPVCEVWNPNAIRSSLGTIFHLPIALGTQLEVRQWLQQRSAAVYAARADGGTPYHRIAYPDRTALVIGSEALGLEDRWRGPDIQSVHIPMHGKIDSLNASVSGSVLLFEVARHRLATPRP